jgi:hypothetical protein
MNSDQILALLVSLVFAVAVAACVDWRGLLGSDGGSIKRGEPIDPCIGCQQAMQRIASGEHSTGCYVCGCHWLDKEAADRYAQNKPPNV